MDKNIRKFVHIAQNYGIITYYSEDEKDET